MYKIAIALCLFLITLILIGFLTISKPSQSQNAANETAKTKTTKNHLPGAAEKKTTQKVYL
jgi:hypothetical protein